MKRLLTLLCLLAAGSGFAITESIDLGSGLSYLRVQSLADAVKAVATPNALVLDLRHATADDAAAALLQTALAGRSPNVLLFILVSPETPTVLLPVISSSPAITLGAAGSRPVPAIVVHTDAAADRQAYDALDAGIPLATLISGKIEKDRFDEATLVEEFKNGGSGLESFPAPTAEDRSKKPVPLSDRVLQRAVHLYHALLALRQS